MATVMECGDEAPVTTADLAVATPARRTTLYDLMAMVQDVVGPQDDTLVVATVVHLLRARQCTWRDCPGSSAAGGALGNPGGGHQGERACCTERRKC